MIAAMAQRMVDVVNESMRIANDSKNIETRRSRVRVAREKIEQVQELATQYPFLKIGRLADVEGDLAKIDYETDELERPESIPKESWRDIRGFRFVARPSFRTPLSTLLRHGETQSVGGELISYEGGAWRPILPALSETLADMIGPEAAEPFKALERPIGASEIGQVDLDELVYFITTIKLAALREDSIEDRAWIIDDIANREENSRYADGYGGAGAIIEMIFPKVLDRIDGIPPLIRADLYKMGLSTVSAIDAATDQRLLAIEGMGKQRLRKLRAWCATYEGDRTEDRIEPRYAANLAGYIW